MIKPVKYACPKCGSRICTIGEVRTASSFFTRLFDIQNRRFTSVTCSSCSYTELYNVPSKRISDVLDFITST